MSVVKCCPYSDEKENCKFEIYDGQPRFDKCSTCERMKKHIEIYARGENMTGLEKKATLYADEHCEDQDEDGFWLSDMEMLRRAYIAGAEETKNELQEEITKLQNRNAELKGMYVHHAREAGTYKQFLELREKEIAELKARIEKMRQDVSDMKYFTSFGTVTNACKELLRKWELVE